MKHIKGRKIKVVTLCLLTLCMLSALTACTAARPETDASGQSWDKNWIMIGTKTGLEGIPEGYKQLDNSDALAVKGVYYQSFSKGEKSEVTDEDGEELIVYPGLIYILTQECDTNEEAEAAIKEWAGKAEAQYTSIRGEFSSGDLKCHTISYTLDKGKGYYVRGRSAFGTCGSVAMCCEMQATKDGPSEEELVETMDKVLADFHFAGDKE